MLPTTSLAPFNLVSSPTFTLTWHTSTGIRLHYKTDPVSILAGDSKSTSQKLSDQTSSTFNSASEQGKSTYDAAADKLSAAGQNIQETVNKNTQQGSSSTGSAEASAKGYLEQAQDLAASALNTASKTAAGMDFSICRVT